MTSEVCVLQPVMHFPIDKVVEIKDQFNGPGRGTFFYRSLFTHAMRGPFMNEAEAEFNRHREDDGS